MVCSGGGAKGVVYPSSYKAMIDTGVYESAKEFSGASAGAISAAMMAVGMSNERFREQLLTTNFKELMGKTVTKKGPGVGVVGGRIITKTGLPLLEFIKKNLNESIQETLAQIDETDLPRDASLQQLFARIKNSSASELRISFGDLGLLNHYFPQHFRQLTIPAVRFPNGEVQIFNSELTPDVEIALACRASASLPVILQPQAISINGEEQLFVDGGLFDNLPTDYFDREAGSFVKNKKADQTLVFAFGEGLDNNSCYAHKLVV
nr:patatin-like phospholipase family protein [Legionella sp. km772]